MDDVGVSDDLVVVNSTETLHKHSDELEILKEILPNAKKKRKSTSMYDDGVSNVFMVVNPTEMVDKHFDELEILMEILPNSKKKSQGKKSDFMVANPTEMVGEQFDELEILREMPANVKRKTQRKKLQKERVRAGQRRCVPLSSSSTGLTSPPQLMQCGNRNWLRGDEKGYKTLVDEGSPCNRRWEDMDHEILIHIFKRYPWHIWCRRNIFVCESWLSAFLDYLFPPGQVLDLSFLDGPDLSISSVPLRMFYRCLILNLDRRPPDSYTGIVLSEYILRSEAYELIARRLPLLKSFVSPEKMIPLYKIPWSAVKIDENFQHYGFIAWWMCPLMQNLERVQCHISMLLTFSDCCKFIRSLTLIGRVVVRGVSDQEASWIAEKFPLLEHLYISGYIFSVNGLSMILDSHKNLQLLDLQHTVCNPDRFFRLPLESPWPEEISKKLESVKTLLTCPGKNCTRCEHYY